MMDSIAAELREADPAQFFASLFVPEEKRAAIMSVRGFATEMARIPFLVSEPALGEIRFQWWHEVLSGDRQGEAASHPLASALMRAVQTYSLPIAALQGLISARVDDLYADPPPSINDLEGRLGECYSVPYRLAALILSADPSRGVADVAGHGGVAEGLVDIIARWPIFLRRSRVMIPSDMLVQYGLTREMVLAGTEPTKLRAVVDELVQKAQAHRTQASRALAELKAEEAPAFLPLALVRPLLTRTRRTWPVSVASLPQWRVQFELWRASRRDVTGLF